MMYDFKNKIEELLENHRRTKKSLYNHLGMSMQGFDAMMKNNSFSAVRLASIAEFFEVPISELYGQAGVPALASANPGEGAEYLQDHLKTLEDNFAQLLQQLSVKDQQIAGLQRTVDALVGKSEGATITQLCGTGDGEFDTMFHQYRMGMLLNVATGLTVNGIVPTAQPAKLVALG